MHLAAAAEGPEDELPVVLQWCLPSSRQHARSFDAVFEVTAGAISEKLKTATSSDAKKRRISLFYLWPVAADKFIRVVLTPEANRRLTVAVRRRAATPYFWCWKRRLARICTGSSLI